MLATDLTSALGVLSAMVTPAVLILASSSLTLTTSTRLTRAVDRVREMAAEMETIGDSSSDEQIANRRMYLLVQLDRSTTRARMLQRALQGLYVGVGLFIATSVSLGLIAVFGLHVAGIALLIGFIGAGFLFYASMLLILESRIAIQQTYAEMDFVLRVRER